MSLSEIFAPYSQPLLMILGESVGLRVIFCMFGKDNPPVTAYCAFIIQIFQIFSTWTWLLL
jgi:hypothetical protein